MASFNRYLKKRLSVNSKGIKKMQTQRLFRGLITAAVILAGITATETHAAQREDDRNAIKAVIEQRTKAFNAKDAAGQAALYSEDAGFYASNGVNSVKGRKQIEALLSRVHESVLKDASLKQEVTSIEFLAPEIAVVMIDLTMTRPEESGGSYKNRGLRIMKKIDGEWQIHTFINQRVIAEQELKTE